MPGQPTPWDQVPQQVKDKKYQNKKSKRDITREIRIKELGGDPVEVVYGHPLQENIREERIEYELTLRYPNRHDLRQKKTKSKPSKSTSTSLLQAIKSNFRSLRSRSLRKDIPFEIELEDLKVNGEIPTRCPILSVDFTFGQSLNDCSPTVDKFNPDLGYVPGNVALICHKANRIKNNGDLNDLEKVVRWIKIKSTTFNY